MRIWTKIALVQVAWCCLLAVNLRATTIIGTVKDPAGKMMTGQVYFQLSQNATSLDPAFVLASTVSCSVRAGSVFTCNVAGNDALAPAGTFYTIRFVTIEGKEFKPPGNYSITGSSWDIGTATPLAIAVKTLGVTEGTGLLQQSTLAYRVTTVTGTIKDPSGKLLTGNVYFQLSQDATSTEPALVLSAPVSCSVRAGNVFTCSLLGNDVISPNGTYYNLRFVTIEGKEFKPPGNYSITGSAWNIGTATPLANRVETAKAIQTVQAEGDSLIQQRNLNFLGAGISCVNDAANSRTNCTVTGGGGSAGNFSNEEGPAGQINGVNVTFTLAHVPSPAASLQLKLDGLTLRSGAGNDFTLSGNTITFAYPPRAGSNLICWYRY